MKALKLLVLFVVVLSGCSQKYLVFREEEFFDRRVLASWEDIECGIVGRDQEGFTIGVRLQNFVEVRDSLRFKEVYMRGYEKEDGRIEQNFFLGLFEVVGGCSIVSSCCFAGLRAGYDSPGGVPPVSVSVGLIPVGIIGFSMMMDGLPQYVKSVKEIPAYVRLDTLCVGEKLLSDEEVKIVLGDLDSEKIYYTDEDGNIKLSFEEIIPELTEAGSMVELIIKYEDLIDTVDVKIK